MLRVHGGALLVGRTQLARGNQVTGTQDKLAVLPLLPAFRVWQMFGPLRLANGREGRLT
jgi:hypothetical protein